MRLKGFASVTLLIAGLAVIGVLLISSGRLGIDYRNIFRIGDSQTEQQTEPAVPDLPTREDDADTYVFPSITPFPGYQLFRSATYGYYFQYPTDETCRIISCASNKYGLRIEEIGYWHTGETWEKTIKESAIFCAAGGPGGITECKYNRHEKFTNKNGVEGFKIFQKKTEKTRENLDVDVWETKIRNDITYLFPIHNEKYPAILFHVDEPTAENLEFIRRIADTFADAEKKISE